MFTVVITLTSHERHGVQNHPHLDCLLKSLFRLTSKKTLKLSFTASCQGNTATGGFPSQRRINTEINALCHIRPCYRVTRGYTSCWRCPHFDSVSQLFCVRSGNEVTIDNCGTSTWKVISNTILFTAIFAAGRARRACYLFRRQVIISTLVGVWCNARRRYSSAHFLMMTSSNVNIFHVTGLLCGEFTGQRWIPLTKASDAEL